jgi:protein SCO1/2
MPHPSRWIALAALVALVACGPRERRFQLEGQVLAIDAARQTLTIKHGDIKGFMQGMTMPFRVKTPALLEGRQPGDLVRATLVVLDNDAYLESVEKTGWAPVPEAGAGAGPAAAPAVPVLAPGAAVPDQAFTDEAGRRFTLSSLQGRTVALTFIYTSCPYPTFCPLMDRQFKEVQTRVQADAALRGRVRLLSLSFDPDHDTPEVLAAHAKELGADPAVWTFATAPRSEIEAFGAHFGLLISRDPKTPRIITHSLSTAVIDPHGRLTALYRGNEWTPDALVGDIAHAAAER